MSHLCRYFRIHRAFVAPPGGDVAHLKTTTLSYVSLMLVYQSPFVRRLNRQKYVWFAHKVA